MAKRVFGAIGIAITMSAIGCGGTVGGSAEVGISSQGTPVNGSPTNFDGYSLGNIDKIPFTNSQATLDLSSGAGDDDYLVVVTSADTTQNSYTVRLSGSSSPTPALTLAPTDSEAGAPDTPDTPSTNEETPANQFHQYLREMESVLADSGERPVTPSSLMALTQAPAVGDLQTFRVLSSMSSISQYEEVTARIRMITSKLIVLVDKNAEDQVTDDDLNTLVQKFEGTGLPKVQELFGVPLDLNTDGHLTILMSCVPNRMTANGIVTGFFSPTDRYSRSATDPASNEQEILYTMVPDPDGSCGGVPISDSFVLSILPGVLSHEYQHLISFDHHVFVYHGATEEPWLNECASHLTEDVTGFGNENPSRVRLFLAQPNTTAIVSATSPTLAERGACYSLLRYLYEQSDDPEGFLWRLDNTDKTGVENLTAAFAGSDASFDEFPEFMNRWSVTLALSETGLTQDPKYNYRPRVKNTETGNYEGLCVRCSAEDGRGTILSGPVVSSVTTFPATVSGTATASQFLQISGADAPAVTLSGGGQNGLIGTVIRLQRP